MKIFKEPQIVYAHCDIPCGIYDPHAAQLAAITVIRMMDLINDSGDASGTIPTHNIARLTVVKEEHAEMCKHEIRVIWGDYFNEEHVKEYPELNDLVREIMALGSKTKQGIDRNIGVKLLDSVNRFAEIFWKTKGIETKLATPPHGPGEEIVYPIL